MAEASPAPEASGTSPAPPESESSTGVATPATAAKEGAPAAVNGAPAGPAPATGSDDLSATEAPEADAAAAVEPAAVSDPQSSAEDAPTAEATAAAAPAEPEPLASAPAKTAAGSGEETAAKAAAETATETAVEPAAKPGTTKAPQGKDPASAKPAQKAATEAGAADGTKTAAKAAAKADSAAAAKPAAKAATKTRTKSTAEPDAKANGKAPAAKSKTAKSRKSTRKRRLQYKVGQQLVYPLQGVGQVRTIEERPFRNKTLLYYVVYLEVSDMTIMVPVDKADELGIRAIVPRAEARNALVLIGEDYEPIPTDWKLRYQMNLDLLKAGSVSDIAAVVRALYHRSRIKELPILERKLYDNARSLLVDELSFSLGKDKAKVEELINTRLEVGVK